MSRICCVYGQNTESVRSRAPSPDWLFSLSGGEGGWGSARLSSACLTEFEASATCDVPVNVSMLLQDV